MHRSDAGLSRLAWFTVLGAILPGSGLLAAGRRVAGVVVLALFVAIATAMAALVATGRIGQVALNMAVRPDALTAVGVGIAVTAVLWCWVIVAGHVALRAGPLPLGQAVLIDLLVVAVCAPVLTLGVMATRYTFIQRSLVTHVFGQPRVPETRSQAPNTPVPGNRGSDPWSQIPRVNVLLIGSDAGPDRVGIRTDTLVVASIDAHTGDTVLISLPRNLENVPFPHSSPLHALYPHGYACGDECLLNAVWRNVGEAHPDLFPGDPSPGLTATWQAVEATLDISLDYYVVVDLHGFIDVIDALGGVTVNVRETLVVGDPSAPIATLRTGRHHLDGQQALWFARVRQGYDDYDRMRRQRCLLGDIARQANPIRLLTHLPALAASAEASIRTDIPQHLLPSFITLAQRVAGARITSLAFTSEVIDTWDPDFTKIRRLTHAAITATPGAGHAGTDPLQPVAKVC
jgi:LCP family protein required for cell wall assembly